MAVWFASGFFCKVLDMVPRHRQIVGRFLGDEHALLMTRTIGFFEIMMVVWILSRLFPRVCATSQILLVITMNVMEVVWTADLLLFGRWNLIPGSLFILVVWADQWQLNIKSCDK